MSTIKRELFLTFSSLEFGLWVDRGKLDRLSLVIHQDHILRARIPVHEEFSPFYFYPSITKVRTEADQFVTKNNLSDYVAKAYSIINAKFNIERIPGQEITLEMARDIESPRWRALKILVEIPVDNYSRILDLWIDIGKQFYRDLDPDIAKRIYIILRKKKERWYIV